MKNVNTKSNSGDRAEVIKNTINIFLPLFILMSGVAVAIYLFYTESERLILAEREKYIVTLQKKYISNDIVSISSDLLFFANSNHLDELFQKTDLLNPGAMEVFTHEFLLFSRASKLYDQIRLLNEEGMEVIRVNFNAGRPVIVPGDGLQNKKSRYYFADTFHLKKNQVFVSPLDLNIEHGEIEKPLKPMIRFGTPVYGPLGSKRGIILMNYLGGHLLKTFSELGEARAGNSMLLNTKGYYLKGMKAEDEWGFMYKGGQDLVFSKQFPAAWQKIQKAEEGQFITPQGLFSFATVFPLKEGQKSSTGAREPFAPSAAMVKAEDYYWKIISHIPPATLYAERITLRRWIAWLVSVLGIVLLFGAWLISVSQVSRRQAEKVLQDSHARLEILVEERTQELKTYQDHLEALVSERTNQIVEKNKELKRFNKLFVGREIKIKELKEELKALRDKT